MSSHEVSEIECIRQIVNHHYSYSRQCEDEVKITVDTNYGNGSIFEIEQLVKRIATTQELAFRVSNMNLIAKKIDALPMAACYPDLNEYLAIYDNALTYNPYIQLFYRTVFEVMGEDCRFPNDPVDTHPLGKCGADLFNEVILRIRGKTNEAAFKKQVRRIADNLKRGEKSVFEYVNALFERFARLLVLRIDLHMPIAEAGSDRVALAQQYFERFLNNKRGNKLFQHVVGYIWKLEEGESRGAHYHVVLFLQGAKVEKDIFICTEIGEYWKRVTKGKGTYFNVNARIPDYRVKGIGIGVGMINHYETEKRENLGRIIKYFFKREQYLSSKRLAKTRVFGKGEMPKRSVLGRPRVRTN